MPRVDQYSQIDSIGVSGDKMGLHWYQWTMGLTSRICLCILDMCEFAIYNEKCYFMTIFYSDEEPLLEYSPGMLHFSPATRVLKENAGYWSTIIVYVASLVKI